MLKIEDLKVSVKEKVVLNNLSMSIKPGEIHAIMGPNGAGKSTFAKFLAGHPSYSLSEGKVVFNNKNMKQMTPEERAQLGLFVSFQDPIEIKGITNLEFFRESYNSIRNEKLDKEEFKYIILPLINKIGLPESFLERFINDGFSGGEKKRNEILQMLLLDPKLIILDEIDSGLDMDALKNISNVIKSFMTKDKSLILITHYRRFIDYIKPDFVHVIINGSIVKLGSFEIVSDIEKKGYLSCL